jgi:hypothetical protein
MMSVFVWGQFQQGLPVVVKDLNNHHIISICSSSHYSCALSSSGRVFFFVPSKEIEIVEFHELPLIKKMESR